MNRRSLKTLKRARNIIVAVGIIGGLIIWNAVPWVISNNRLMHVGNGQYGSKIGLLILLVLPLLSFLASMEQEEIHTDDETERARLEEETKKAVVNKQICLAIGESITVWFLMCIAVFFTH